ncbi:NAD-dependent protein deacetylase, SIR2 family [Streptomyces sp. 3213]|uniref:Sir2 family NAD-dependent protein deacetylase n=1 Tax=Streptomyces sp. 3213.3 TaxID=1855348 RepID=UPI000897FBBA|nr:Sir2 family NAD-dependent protein deacetylase [Streptomyces sp. 3213.3]SEC37553.1 NAD-dependent protein deacetylase, SIR2 family [Streptomyces sp. 3213] [Streptomyces sp. 3213.3]
MSDHLIDRLADWLREADRILIGAGAGLSAAAGIDYNDAASFTRDFPTLAARGFRTRYEMIGRPLPPELHWAYLAANARTVRFDPRPNPLYQQLRELLKDTDHFVWTSNVDGLFARNGFAPERVFTPQGDYALYQCATPCTGEVWDFEPVAEKLVAATDPTTGTVIERTVVPDCPNCGGEVQLNVRVNGAFIEDHYLPTGRALLDWAQAERDSRLLVLDLGTGYNTPTVVRLPMEYLTRMRASTRLVRVNLEHSEVPDVLGHRALAVPMDAADVLDALAGAALT